MIIVSGWLNGFKFPLRICSLKVTFFEDGRRQGGFAGEFLIPLLAEIGGDNDEQFPFALCPFLREQNAGLDGLAQADLVGQDCASRQGGTEGEQGSVNLVGVQINLGIGERCREFLNAVRSAAFRQFVREILRVKSRSCSLLHASNRVLPHDGGRNAKAGSGGEVSRLAASPPTPKSGNSLETGVGGHWS